MPTEPAHWLLRGLAEIAVVVGFVVYLGVLIAAYSFHWGAAAALLALTVVWFVRG